MSDSYREFANYVRDVIEGIASDFDSPDDDYVPVAALDLGDKLAVMPIPPEAIASAQSKNALAQLMAMVAKNTGARKLAFVTSAWTLDLRSDKYPGGREQMERELDEWLDAHDGSIEHHPDRVEQVQATIMDPERVEVHRARIMRNGIDPPWLEPWDEQVFTNPDVSGRFIDVQKAMQ